MARTPSALSRRRGLKSRTGARATTTPKPARDGKVNIFCPQCGAEYRIPHNAVDQRVQCRHCHRLFSPRATFGARRRPQVGAATFIWSGVGIIALIGLGVLIKSIGTRQPAARPVATPRAVDIGWSNPRIAAIRRWINAVAAGESFGIETGADLAELQEFLAIPSERRFRSAFPEERKELTAKILDALATTEQTLVFREFEMTSGQLGDQSMAESSTGKAILYFEPRDPRVRGTATVSIDFRMDGRTPLVTRWEVLSAPEIATATPEGTTRDADPGDAAETHPEISEPQSVKALLSGSRVTINESELVPLDHLPDTPQELRTEIDTLIATLLDIDGPGALANRAIDRLDDIGRPAIPRLLNQFQALAADLDGNNFKLTRIDRALRVMTGRAFGYNPGTHLVQIEKITEQRISALKQWYAWWFKYHDRDYAAIIDKQESLPTVKRKTIRNQPQPPVQS